VIALISGFEPGEFWERLARCGERILLLDYDGTLAPFRVERDKAVPYAGIREILNEIMESEQCRIVIVSGRWTKDLLPLLGLKRRPEIWGSHGIERLFPDGRYETVKLDKSIINALARVDSWAEDEQLQDRCERKPGSVAFHWRGLDRAQTDGLRSKVMKEWSDIATEAGLMLYEFDGGIELRAPIRNKGDAVSTILSEAAPEGAVTAYLGDDLTDEDAFRAIKGKGIGVLVRKERRETEADLWLKPPEELLEFLKNWARASM